MKSKYIYAVLFLCGIISACSKDEEKSPLPKNSISISAIRDDVSMDTLTDSLSVIQDTTLVVGLFAKNSVNSSQAHWVSFKVDTTKFQEYINNYGNALLLPSSSYYFYKPMCKIAAGSSLSDSAQINIVQQTKLKATSTYVLPMTIQSVDGVINDDAKEQTLYLVFKTGKSNVADRSAWTIAGVSSVYATFVATNAIDNDDFGTYWVSDISAQMPQWIAINFNASETFRSVQYSIPATAIGYPDNGGYPTSFKIETSTDGTIWVDKGTYNSDIDKNTQTINIETTTAKYLKFTALNCAKYYSQYNAIFISGINISK